MINISDISVRKSTNLDVFPIFELLKKYGMGSRNIISSNEVISNWKRYSIDNPFYNYFSEEVLFGWVLEHNNKIVGFFGSIPRIYHLNNEMVPVSVASQWVIEKEYRKYSYLLKDKYFLDNPIATKLVTSASNATGKIFENYHGFKVPCNSLQNVYVIPLNLTKSLEFIFSKYPLLKWFLTRISKIIPWQLQFKKIPLKYTLKQYQINNNSQQLKQFWDLYLKKNNKFIASRNLETMNWYYNSGKLYQNIISLVLYNSLNEIEAFASVIDAPVIGNDNLKRYILIDILVHNPKFKRDILKGVLKYLYQNNVDILEIQLPGMVKRIDIPAISLIRKLANFPAYFQTSCINIETYLKNSTNWQLSCFDGDSTLG